MAFFFHVIFIYFSGVEIACRIPGFEWVLFLQHVLERGKPIERSQIMSKLMGNIILLSQHKYASNVVEKCLEYGDAAERENLIEEILAQPEENDNLLVRAYYFLTPLLQLMP